MTLNSVVQVAYIVAALLFIGALAGLSKHETAKRGNLLGMIGMTIALVATVVIALRNSAINGLIAALLIVVAIAIGAAIGIWRAVKVEMTGMPQLIAMLHSFVGLAAVLVGFNTYLDTYGLTGSELRIHLVEIVLGVFIGAVTLTGSIVAWGKLSGRFSSAPLMLPHRHLINLAALIISFGLLMWFVLSPNLLALLLVTVVSLAIGVHLIASIGGGDMPVVVSMLNSYSGWAAAFAGFMLG
ncbi:MAG: NAD(P)(+) transhydrogenase (Re/Si-specific) subunit beta, partial [Antricoccus sp.]